MGVLHIRTFPPKLTTESFRGAKDGNFDQCLMSVDLSAPHCWQMENPNPDSDRWGVNTMGVA
eukprot:3968553-Pyramimonas_sp.AAC.1